MCRYFVHRNFKQLDPPLCWVGGVGVRKEEWERKRVGFRVQGSRFRVQGLERKV